MNFPSTVAPSPTSFVSHADTIGSPRAMPLCPFYDGIETLDLLLGEIHAQETDLLDATLDLRFAVAAGQDAEHCLAQLFRVRALLNDRHYLAFYRVRRLFSRLIVAQTRPHRASNWTTREVPSTCARFDELINLCLSPLAENGEIPATARIRFVFSTPATTPLLFARASE